jgi:hypothetical protein
MNNLDFNKKRKLSIEWWLQLPTEAQKELAQKYFPDKDFILITTSSTKIQFIWEQIHSSIIQ